MSGSVAYRERIGLPPDAVVEVKLSYVSALDAPAGFSEAIPEYQLALELGRESGEASLSVERLLIDQLGMAYGIAGRHEEAKALLDDAITKDAEYPMYYYNLACTYAEMGKLDEALINLRLGFARRAQMLPGETFPNPRADDSFKRYLGNETFEAAVKEMDSKAGAYRQQAPVPSPRPRRSRDPDPPWDSWRSPPR